MIPGWYAYAVRRLNRFLSACLRPSKTSLVFLMLSTGTCYTSDLGMVLRSTMTIRILHVLSIPADIIFPLIYGFDIPLPP